ncbi:MAG: nuclear transport factor 2 family protein [Candidatus Dormibacteraeota bacterium]|nr:nuclear transport factor 2 family protein [Candidatus Dormibacteraeota bacterium]
METAATTSNLDQLVREHQEHNNHFFNGDPQLDDWVHDDSVTLHGGFGFSAKGWDEVRPGLIKASARLRDGEMKFLPMGGNIAGDFAYLVGSEEGTVVVDGERRPMRLKVTMVLRRVGGRWLALHRHGEMLPQA